MPECDERAAIDRVKRYCRFDITGADRNSGPLISSKRRPFDRLHDAPEVAVVSPRSRNHRPPGHGSMSHRQLLARGRLVGGPISRGASRTSLERGRDVDFFGDGERQLFERDS